VLLCDDGTAATIRRSGCAAVRETAHPFWIHGATGTIRGSVLGRDRLELETGAGVQNFTIVAVNAGFGAVDVESFKTHAAALVPWTAALSATVLTLPPTFASSIFASVLL
jgi:hypothetical protein